MQLQNDFHTLTRQRLNHRIQKDVGHHLDLNEPRLQLGFLGLNQPLFFLLQWTVEDVEEKGWKGKGKGVLLIK